MEDNNNKYTDEQILKHKTHTVSLETKTKQMENGVDRAILKRIRQITQTIGKGLTSFGLSWKTRKICDRGRLDGRAQTTSYSSNSLSNNGNSWMHIAHPPPEYIAAESICRYFFGQSWSFCNTGGCNHGTLTFYLKCSCLAHIDTHTHTRSERGKCRKQANSIRWFL